ncbi:PrsW family intramembrane metalloprotease [Actinoallomurus purpureus]|uniref:PrsW family intramembrane metalloprotease n=1 Tax=Actinoallomurus purpureus TaxID=478114 RepID=UPI0020929868|nr:PrsW family intramembrane metalloprotease [Actinoallomurus purpureus]MCO6007919.1 PrsW family intramembrane metalloprotease [Actinoallomurus purpureus]
MTRVDPKAILEGRMPGRAPVGLIIGLVVSSACAIVVLGLDAMNGAPFIVGLVLAILPVPLLIALVLTLDRLEPEPWRALLFAFMWGAGVAVLGALILNTAGYELLTKPVFGERGELVTASVGAPLVEESLKGAVLFGFLWFRRNELDGLTDGIIYAAMVALGFAMMENVGYYIRAFHQHNLEAVFIMRGVISPFGHPLFTSMTGLGVAYAALHRGAARVVAPVVGLCMAMLLHGAWNFSTAFGLKGLMIAYGIDFLILIGLIVTVRWERRQTVHLIQRHLPMYAGTGLVTPQDVHMLGNLKLRRRARQWARMVGGARAGRAMADYQLAATELALLHQRAERQVAEPAWFYRRRQDLLNLMHLARQAFQDRRTRPLVPPWAGQGQSGFLHPGPSYGPPPPGPFSPPGPYAPGPYGPQGPQGAPPYGPGTPGPYGGPGTPGPYGGPGTPGPYGGRGTPGPYGGRGPQDTPPYGGQDTPPGPYGPGPHGPL